MTLILTYLQSDAIVQMSDCRITRRGAAKERDDTARKLIHYAAPEAQLAISYTGLADISQPNQPHRSIEQWLARAIAGSGATRTDDMFNSLLPRIAQAVEDTRRLHGVSVADARLTVLCAGFLYGKPHPFILTISNFEALGQQIAVTEERPRLTRIPVEDQVPFGEFGMYWADYSGQAPNILAHGDLSGLTPDVIKSLAQCVLNAGEPTRDLHAIRNCLLVAVREAGKRSKQRTISDDCWSTILKRDDPTGEYESHFRADKSTVVNPLFVGLGVSMQPVLSVPSTAASENYMKLLESGRRGIEVNADSVRAAIDRSPLLRQWATHYERRGHTVSYGTIFDIVGIVRYAGILYAESIETHLAKAAKWGDSFVEEYVLQSEAEMQTWSGQSTFSTTTDVLLITMLVALNPLRLSDEVLRGRFGLISSFDDVRELAARQAKRPST